MSFNPEAAKANDEKRWEEAKKRVSEIVADGEKWNLFSAQVKNHDAEITDDMRSSENYRSFLAFTYMVFVAPHICDFCDYNPKWRHGEKKFARRKVFYCNWKKTDGDVFAEETAKKEGYASGALYNFRDTNWEAEYERRSQTVLEAHTDKSKPPAWLDVGKNLCSHRYLDLTKP